LFGHTGHSRSANDPFSNQKWARSERRTVSEASEAENVLEIWRCILLAAETALKPIDFGRKTTKSSV
jgi:hypothetical protein